MDGLCIVVCGTDERISVDVVTELPSPLPPILIRQIVGNENINVRLHNADLFQTVQAPSNQCLSDTAPPIRFLNDDMLKVTSATIVTAHGAANYVSIFSDEAESRIPIQVTRDSFFRVRFANRYAGGSRHEREHFVITV